MACSSTRLVPAPTTPAPRRSPGVTTGVHHICVMPEVTFINGDCYEIIDNADCNAPNEYVLVELGPHHSWDEISRIEDWEECPF